MLVVWTDKGYVKGDITNLEFVQEKNQARKFTNDEFFLYKDSIAQDLFDFFGCKKFGFEVLE